MSCIESSENGSTPFAIDHSLCSRMIVILEKSSIPWRCQSPYHHRWQTCHIQVSPYLFSTFHMMSTFEKTTCRHCSILRSLMSWPALRVSPYLFAAHWTSSEVRSDFQIWVSPEVSDAVEGSTFGSLTRYRDTACVIGFDFAVTLSSPASPCVLFDIASRLLMELKWLMLKRTQKMVPITTCEISLCQYVCELCTWFGSWVQIDSIKQPIKSNSVGSGNVSQCKASSLYDHLDHCFIVFKDVQQSFLTRRIHVRGNKSTLSRSSIFPRIFFRAGDVDKSPCTCSLWFVSPWRTATIRSHKSSAGFPTNNCVQGNDLLFCWTVRNWSLFLAHSSYGTNVWLPKTQCSSRSGFWILKIFLQNQSLETIPICIVLQCFPHDNIVCVHLYDECKRSNDKIVGHMFWSILWLIVQICFLAIEYQVFQYVPNISISKQFESIVLTSLPRISILLLKNDGRQGMELILCRVVESSCLPTHNIVPHISWHDPSEHGNFQLLLRKYWTQTWFWNCQHCLCLCHSIFEYIPGKHGQGMMLVLPNRLLCLTLSTSV